jgi:hypothetical protein
MRSLARVQILAGTRASWPTVMPTTAAVPRCGLARAEEDFLADLVEGSGGAQSRSRDGAGFVFISREAQPARPTTAAVPVRAEEATNQSVRGVVCLSFLSAVLCFFWCSLRWVGFVQISFDLIPI